MNWFFSLIWTAVLFCFFLFPELSNAQNTSYFVGIKEQGELVAETIELRNPGTEIEHLLVNGETEIPIEEVNYFQSHEGFFLVKQIEPLGYVKLKNIIQGPVSVYHLSTRYFRPGLQGGLPIGYHDISEYYYLKDAEMISLTPQNLKRDLASDEQTVKAIKRLRRRKLTKVVLAAAGVSLMVVGINKMFTSEITNGTYKQFQFSMNPPFLIGLLMVAVPLTAMNNKDEPTVFDIIEDYNSRKAASSEQN
ncbi:hypothetical protein [Marinoscillum sp. MHG1-6]|uniref:hypothetical protein n=1 Tax=Marinoscillum sp. MHG1-6 TaxID=2959627 RepID=UPI002157D1B4|nr:hypothetical protein [Marinoscillum sp. MHG1-6]